MSRASSSSNLHPQKNKILKENNNKDINRDDRPLPIPEKKIIPKPQNNIK